PPASGPTRIVPAVTRVAAVSPPRKREPRMADSDEAERIRRRFRGHDPAAGTDTGGTPWAGRQFTGTGFDTDTGAADPRLLALLTARGNEPASRAEAAAADPEVAFEDDIRLVELVAAARLIVPVVAVAGETAEANGLTSDASSDMAAVTLVAPGGEHKALPAFTSLQTLADWDPSARPVPVTAQRAAQAAVRSEERRVGKAWSARWRVD